MKKKVWVAIGIILLIAVIIGVNVTRNQGEKIVSVKTATASMEKISASIFLDGKADLNGKKDVRSKVMGVVKEIKAESGDNLTSGQAVIYLETKDMELQKQQAQNTLNMVNDKLTQLKAAPVSTIPGQSNALAIKSAELDVQSAQSALDKIKSQIADSVIKSPIDGMVLSRNAQPGMTVTPDVVLFSVGNPKDLIIKAQVSEVDILKIQKGQSVKITGDSFADKEYKGEVSEVAQVPNSTGVAGLGAATGQSDNTNYQVIIKIIDANTLLRAGFSTNLEVVTENKDSALVVANEALLEKEDSKSVYVVEKGLVKIKKVKTGIAGDSKTEITEGLKSGDKVIINPDENVLKENTKVKTND